MRVEGRSGMQGLIFSSCRDKGVLRFRDFRFTGVTRGLGSALMLLRRFVAGYMESLFWPVMIRFEVPTDP